MRTEYKAAIWHMVAIDYVTLTSEDESYGIYWRGLLEELWPWDEPEPGRTMQYEGLQYPHAFIGVANGAGGKPHYMVRVSGAMAHRFAQMSRENGVARCTRIDVQYSIRYGESVQAAERPDLRQWADNIQAARDEGVRVRGRPRKLLLMDGEGDGRTLYFGSRTSDRFLRIYEKQTPESYGVRAEVQYRNEYAHKAWHIWLRGGQEAIERVWISEVSALPWMPVELEECVGAISDGTTDRAIRVEREVTTVEQKMAWISLQVRGSLLRIKREIGDEAYDAWMERLLA